MTEPPSCLSHPPVFGSRIYTVGAPRAFFTCCRVPGYSPMYSSIILSTFAAVLHPATFARWISLLVALRTPVSSGSLRCIHSSNRCTASADARSSELTASTDRSPVSTPIPPSSNRPAQLLTPSRRPVCRGLARGLFGRDSLTRLLPALFGTPGRRPLSVLARRVPARCIVVFSTACALPRTAGKHHLLASIHAGCRDVR